MAPLMLIVVACGGVAALLGRRAGLHARPRLRVELHATALVAGACLIGMAFVAKGGWTRLGALAAGVPLVCFAGLMARARDPWVYGPLVTMSAVSVVLSIIVPAGFMVIAEGVTDFWRPSLSGVWRLLGVAGAAAVFALACLLAVRWAVWRSAALKSAGEQTGDAEFAAWALACSLYLIVLSGLAIFWLSFLPWKGV